MDQEEIDNLDENAEYDSTDGIVSVMRVCQVCQQLMFEVFMTVNDLKNRA